MYVADLVGIDTVGFGSDYDGFSSPPIVPDVSQLVLLTQAMLARGLTEEESWVVQGPFAGKVFTSEDAKEGPRAFAEKREPKWTGR